MNMNAPRTPLSIPTAEIQELEPAILSQQQQNENPTTTEEMNGSQIPIRSPVVQVSNSQPSEPKKKSTKPAEMTRTDSQKKAEESRDTEAENRDDPLEDLADFDWEEFQGRYSKAMMDASVNEQALRDEFNRLVQYFGVWASAASNYDNDRSAKRIKTRAIYVQHAENSLQRKKDHYAQVVEAFKNALALLGGT